MIDWFVLLVEFVGYFSIIGLVAFVLFAMLCVAKTPRDLPGSFYDNIDPLFGVGRRSRKLPKHLRARRGKGTKDAEDQGKPR